jgi:hypothetical protein
MRRILTTLLFAVPLIGAPIYTTGFEGPTFTNGSNLTSLDGWISGSFGGNGLVAVSNIFNNGGSQSVFLLGNTMAMTAGAIRPVSYTTTPGVNVLIAADVYVPANSSRNVAFDLVGMEGSSLLNQLIGYVRITPGLAVQVYGASLNNTAAVLAADAWSRLGIWANFSNRTFDVTVNGTTVASNVAFAFNTNQSNVLYAGGFATSSPGSTANGIYFADNFAITAEVPEPSTFLLAIPVLAAFALRRRK